MAGLPPPTGFRSSPEDAAFYREFHDMVVSALREGRTPEQIVEQLRVRNLPESTARRIVWAVGHEAQQADFHPGRETRQLIGTMWAAVVFALAILGFIAWRVVREGAGWRTVVPGVVVFAIMSCIVFARFGQKLKGPKL